MQYNFTYTKPKEEITMIQIIAGEKGNGKTKCLLDKVNSEIKSVHGNIVYLDKNSKHMYELNNKVRLIDASEFMIDNADNFIGFICGVISQDHDLEQMYLDSFLKISLTDAATANDLLRKLDKISEKFGVTFVISISLEGADIAEDLKKYMIAEL